MIFRKAGRLPNDLRFIYDGMQIDIVEKFVYLGILFTTGGSFSGAQNTLAGQSLKAIFRLNKYIYKFTNLSVKHKLDLFDKLVLPILNYGNEVWGFHGGKAVEKVHMQYCKRLLGVKKCTQNDFIYGELGRTSLQCQRLVNIVKYWIKIMNMSDQKYVKIVYNLLYNDLLDKPTCVNWCTLLRNLLYSLDLAEVWNYQSVGNIGTFLMLVHDRINDRFIVELQSRIRDSTRASLYRYFDSFGFKSYLDVVTIGKFRTCLTQLRVASHRLYIETGRWHKPQKIPVTERKCYICNVLEDEYHFVMECCLYESLRKKFLPVYYYKRPSMVKFVELLCTNDDILIRKLASYVFHAFQLRSNVVYVRN